MEEKKEKKEKKHKRSYKGAIVGLSIVTGILGLTTIGMSVANGMVMSQNNQYSTELENVYRKNYFELVDSANNVDMKISKLLASDSFVYQAKMLGEVTQSTKEMQNNISSLPLSSDNIAQCVRFVNQLSGYTQILEEKINQGGTLSQKDLETLESLRETLTEIKTSLNKMSQKIMSGYSILRASKHLNGQYDDFSTNFSQIKASDTDYPTMIYDGPFSDSVVNAQIKGLKGDEVTKEDAYKKIDKLFKNISNLKYDGTANGRFSTYNFSLLNSNNQRLFVQVTKIGGNVLTVSGQADADVKNINFDQAKKIALDFASANGIENGEVVWSEQLNSECYFNIAPTQNGVVLYPDLVKVKVDMQYGDVIGYDAMTYFTNHTNRNLVASGIGIDIAKEKIDTSFAVKNQRIVLAPLDYNREVLCYEFEAERDGAVYYIYVNALSGQEENILKVVETDDSSKLM